MSWARRVRDLPARSPLRIKLVAAMLGLLVIGLAVTGVAAWTAMRSYLTKQVDVTLTAAAQNVRVSPSALGDLAAATCLSPDDGRFGGQPTSYFVQVTNSTGTLACAPSDGSARFAPHIPSMTTQQAALLGGAPFTVGSNGGDQHWRVEAIPVQPASSVLFVAVSLDSVDHTLGQLLFIEIVGGIAVVVLLGAVGYEMVRRSLRPLVEVEEAAEDIAAGDLSRRVPELDARTEVGRLSAAFNAMLGHIETAFRAREKSEAAALASEKRMRRFVADASHELRTPLTSIRGFAELYRQGAVPDSVDVARIMRRIEDQATRMGVLVEDLLLLARLDQQRPLELAPVNLGRIAQDATQDATVMDGARPIRLRVPDDGQPVLVLADDTRLRQVVGNLMSNALTHTPPGTPVTVSVATTSGFGVLSVADEGPGLSADDAAHVFERFYRTDISRTRASGGTGLGLSIASALVTAHGGELTVETSPGEGATFVVTLPLAPAGADLRPSAPRAGADAAHVQAQSPTS
jgi:two-component system, OmpR family, sensor kinase